MSGDVPPLDDEAAGGPLSAGGEYDQLARGGVRLSRPSSSLAARAPAFFSGVGEALSLRRHGHHRGHHLGLSNLPAWMVAAARRPSTISAGPRGVDNRPAWLTRGGQKNA